MKIAFFGIDEQDKIDFYKQNLAQHTLEFHKDCLSLENLPDNKDIDIISIFVQCHATKEVIDSLPNLKLITVRSTGFDNVDIKYAKSKKIIVTNVPTYGSHTVAEFTFGLILSLSRRIPEAVTKIKSTTDFSHQGLRGFDLYQKTIGVIGTGKIGANVIKIAKGFEMKILAFDLYPNQKLAQELNFNYVSLDELLKQSDIITLHTPATEQTQHLINKENIFKIKPGAILINTARGTIVETEALFEAIKSKHLLAAGIDVLEEESKLKNPINLSNNELDPQSIKSLLEDKILIDLPNVIITPHMAFYTKEAEDSIMHTTLENINNFLNNAPSNVVN